MLQLLHETNPICTPAWSLAGRTFTDAMFWLPPRTRVEIHGVEHLPRGPAIFCPNHTHKFDFLPLRAALLHRDMQLMTWIKARDYKHPAMRWILGKGGNVPLASRGYLIASDFAAVHRRKPTDDEYRALRTHVDDGAPLERIDPVIERSLRTARPIAGVSVDFAQGYRGAIREAYRVLMAESLRLARRGRDLGRHQHVYPQGATSKQLTPGHIGAVQAALALDIPLIPVGMSGCREVFVGRDHPLTRGGRVVLRFGAAMEVPKSCVSAAFEPFNPDDEDAHKDALQAQTDALMARVNALCEPAYRWADDLRSDGKQGVARFYT
ncbi:MAG: lysophospholipid acyltransferase family protein [Deltaproteobacteria bacterium]|nr:lysophospholipid acyltransferase family protein [Deltaproteobacteria bacterium]